MFLVAASLSGSWRPQHLFLNQYEVTESGMYLLITAERLLKRQTNEIYM